MRLARYALGYASSMIWPAVVLVIPMGITLASARVYAESGAAAPAACSSAEVTACSDAGELQACECGGGECACTSSRCVANGAPVDALICKPVPTSCRLYSLQPCEGKTAGAACTQPASNGGAGATGTCTVLSNGCLEKGDAGIYVTARPLACDAPLNPAEAGATSAAGDGNNETSGCSVAAGAAGAGASALFAAPLGLGLLLARRRRRPTRSSAP